MSGWGSTALRSCQPIITSRRARRLLYFLEPEAEARFLALSSATRFLPLREASRLIEEGKVHNRRDGRVVGHLPARMVLPVSQALKERFAAPEYARAVEDAARALDLEVTQLSAQSATPNTPS